MRVQGERIAGFILITGIDGIRYAARQNAVSVISDHMRLRTRPVCSCMAALSSACPPRSMKCCGWN
jgi:hypothetical protein